LGLLVAARPRTIEGVSGLMNFAMFPMWIFSGVFFSYERFPDAVKPLIRALPLTLLNDALRGVINDGMSIALIAPKMLWLFVWGLVTFTVGVKIFRWQ
jgi:ABC-2 type transport system permease protein